MVFLGPVATASPGEIWLVSVSSAVATLFFVCVFLFPLFKKMCAVVNRRRCAATSAAQVQCYDLAPSMRGRLTASGKP